MEIPPKAGTSKITALAAVGVLFGTLAAAGSAIAQTDKPNILIIWGDDIGQTNISAHTMGLV